MSTFAGFQTFASPIGNCSILRQGQRHEIVDPLLVERFLCTHAHTHRHYHHKKTRIKFYVYRNLFLSDLGLNHFWQKPANLDKKNKQE